MGNNLFNRGTTHEVDTYTGKLLVGAGRAVELGKAKKVEEKPAEVNPLEELSWTELKELALSKEIRVHGKSKAKIIEALTKINE